MRAADCAGEQVSVDVWNIGDGRYGSPGAQASAVAARPVKLGSRRLGREHRLVYGVAGSDMDQTLRWRSVGVILSAFNFVA